MRRIFALFTVNYGGLWSARFKDERAYEVGVTEWLRQLRDLHIEELGEGYERSVRLHRRGPPSIGEFRALCRSPDPAHQQWIERDASTKAAPDSPAYLAFVEAVQALRDGCLESQDEPD